MWPVDILPVLETDLTAKDNRKIKTFVAKKKKKDMQKLSTSSVFITERIFFEGISSLKVLISISVWVCSWSSCPHFLSL